LRDQCIRISNGKPILIPTSPYEGNAAIRQLMFRFST
jgi:hypothetical protein